MWASVMQQVKRLSQLKQSWRKFGVGMIAIAFVFLLSACGGDKPTTAKSKAPVGMSEVSPPAEIMRLSRFFDRYEPQIKIISPTPDQVITDNKVAVSFEIKDLPVFKSDLGLGPHIHVILDNQEYRPLYNSSDTITFDSLTPGTHTLRVFASRPWHESFKNEGAYAQVTFHAFAKTGENTPSPQSPLLTYSRPVGSYGAEPIMLDFYLKNAPLHLAALEDAGVTDWQIRATVNGKSFLLENWQPIYLTGFKPGTNWVSLEFLDAQGNPILNQFNSTAHLIEYQPGGQDTLSRLMRGEVIADIESIIDPTYVAKKPEPEAIPESIEPVPATKPAEVKPEVKPEPKAEKPLPVPSQPEPLPEVKPEPVASPEPKQNVKPEPLKLTSPPTSPYYNPKPAQTTTTYPRRKLIKRKRPPEPKTTPTADPTTVPTVSPEPETPTKSLEQKPERKPKISWLEKIRHSSSQSQPNLPKPDLSQSPPTSLPKPDAAIYLPETLTAPE